MFITLFLFVFLPLVAVFLGFRAKSPVARRILIIGGAFFLLVSALALTAASTCDFGDFRFRNCSFLSAGIAQIISTAWLLMFALGGPVAAVLLVVSALYLHCWLRWFDLG